jgi:hypothetical protein
MKKKTRKNSDLFPARNVTTIEDLRHAFPSLDAVDHKRRRGASKNLAPLFASLFL